jgi:transposase
MISSLRSDGTTACMTVDGATDTEVFLVYTETTLVPSLRPGDIVILDNLLPHRSPRVAELIRAAGAHICFLPPYSPDLNPIEQMWSKVKATLRRIEARTLDALVLAIRAALKEVTAEDAISWFAHCGYTFI